MTSPSFADQIRTAPAEIAEGEAALTVACWARGRGDARLLLDRLGLTGAAYRWDAARVARVILERSRHGRDISANTTRLMLPRRAWPLTGTALTALMHSGLTVPAGRKVTASWPEARYRKLTVFRLTFAGERLAAELAPMSGELPAARFGLDLDDDDDLGLEAS